MFLGVATVSMLGVLALSIERFVTFEQTFFNLSYANLSYNDNNTFPFGCSKWFCTADFTFTIVILVNLGKKVDHSEWD